MDDITRSLTGTSQGATPIADGGTRAAIFLIVNAITQYVLELIEADASLRALVATIENPLLLVAFGVWDKLDSIIQARRGVTTGPTETQVPSAKVEPQ